MSDYIRFKWGTVKGWNLENSPKAFEKMCLYLDEGKHSVSAMCQDDTEKQKQLLCDVIDSFDGQMTSDWSGEVFTKESAKAYIMNYGKD